MEHDMELVKTHEDGREEWACPICGKRVLFRSWPPQGIEVLEPGEAVAHSYTKCGFRDGDELLTVEGMLAELKAKIAAEAPRPSLTADQEAELRRIYGGITY